MHVITEHMTEEERMSVFVERIETGEKNRSG